MVIGQVGFLAVPKTGMASKAEQASEIQGFAEHRRDKWNQLGAKLLNNVKAESRYSNRPTPGASSEPLVFHSFDELKKHIDGGSANYLSKLYIQTHGNPQGPKIENNQPMDAATFHHKLMNGGGLKKQLSSRNAPSSFYVRFLSCRTGLPEARPIEGSKTEENREVLDRHLADTPELNVTWVERFHALMEDTIAENLNNKKKGDNPPGHMTVMSAAPCGWNLIIRGHNFVYLVNQRDEESTDDKIKQLMTGGDSRSKKRKGSIESNKSSQGAKLDDIHRRMPAVLKDPAVFHKRRRTEGSAGTFTEATTEEPAVIKDTETKKDRRCSSIKSIGGPDHSSTPSSPTSVTNSAETGRKRSSGTSTFETMATRANTGKGKSAKRVSVGEGSEAVRPPNSRKNSAVSNKSSEGSTDSSRRSSLASSAKDEEEYRFAQTKLKTVIDDTYIPVPDGEHTGTRALLTRTTWINGKQVDENERKFPPSPSTET